MNIQKIEHEERSKNYGLDKMYFLYTLGKIKIMR